jgi:nucleoside-diphosphate-sugar epimerase
MPPRTIVITGAAGNLGSLLARGLAGSEHKLRLMVHRTYLPVELARASNVEVVHADLADPKSLLPVVEGADVVVHFAGVLFSANPKSFLPITNTQWFANLLDACLAKQVGRVILISFPHVEGPTTPDHRATGRLDQTPISWHARTRLEEERLLFARTEGTSTVPVSLRLGMVYGNGILMVDAARWAARHRLLGVWRDPTWIHLISTEDYVKATIAAAVNEGVSGIYHVGDEKPVTLQEFLDRACDAWGLAHPWRMPLWMIHTAAALCELQSSLFGTRAPLTRDFIDIGRVSYCGDTARFCKELLPVLAHPSLESGIRTLTAG